MRKFPLFPQREYAGTGMESILRCADMVNFIGPLFAGTKSFRFGSNEEQNCILQVTAVVPARHSVRALKHPSHSRSLLLVNVVKLSADK